MSYSDGVAKTTGHIGELEADLFLIGHGFTCCIPLGRDIGIDRIVRLTDRPGKTARIQIKGRCQVENPRWFQLTVPGAQLSKAYANGQDLNELWKTRIDMVDFWIMVSIPHKEVWVFPTKIIHEIAQANFRKYHTRRDNDYSQIYLDKKGKVEKKQRELNLEICDEKGIVLFEKYKDYKNNAQLIRDFLNS